MQAKDIMDALIKSLKDIMPNAKVYTERVKQGFKRPSFFIFIKQKELPLLNDRYERTFKIELHYYGDEKGRISGDYEMLETISSIISALEVNGKTLRAKELSDAIKGEDDYIILTFNYSIHIFKRLEFDKMGALEMNKTMLK